MQPTTFLDNAVWRRSNCFVSVHSHFHNMVIQKPQHANSTISRLWSSLTYTQPSVARPLLSLGGLPLTSSKHWVQLQTSTGSSHFSDVSLVRRTVSPTERTHFSDISWVRRTITSTLLHVSDYWDVGTTGFPLFRQNFLSELWDVLKFDVLLVRQSRYSENSEYWVCRSYDTSHYSDNPNTLTSRTIGFVGVMTRPIIPTIPILRQVGLLGLSELWYVPLFRQSQYSDKSDHWVCRSYDTSHYSDNPEIPTICWVIGKTLFIPARFFVLGQTYM